MNGLQDMMKRSSTLTQRHLELTPEEEEILMMRRDGDRQRQLQPEQEQVLGAPPDQGPQIQDDVLQYFRQMGIPDEVIFRELGIGAR